MGSFQVRTDPGQAARPGTHVLLDWFADDRRRSTVQVDQTFLKGLSPTSLATDFLRLGGAVFCADKIAPREGTEDSWTREIELELPVSDPDAWRGVADPLHEALNFLSGDRWNLTFAPGVDAHDAERASESGESVSLFSGGLDSLAGAIDRLEDGARVALVGHHDSSLTDQRQVELFGELERHYGSDRVSLRRLLLRPAAARSTQERPVRGSGENTTRSRSILFVAAGIAVADALGEKTPLVVPENGFIGINVPLTAARLGSLSTRTTHPYYMERLARVLEALGLSHGIENPYRLATKGEALESSANRPLLERLAPRTISCSHPEAPRWRHRDQGNCGYCYPCLIRRASMHRIGLDRACDYAWDALTDPEFLDSRLASGRSLRALAARLGVPERPSDVIRNGAVPAHEVRAFFELYQRGRSELSDWLVAGASPQLRARCGLP